MKTYVYVDGESHYIRSEKTLKAAHGEERTLTDIKGWLLQTPHVPTGGARIYNVHHDDKGKFFWAHGMLLQFCNHFWQLENIKRSVYFTSWSGGREEIDELQCKIRLAGFEPVVQYEPAQNAKNRRNLLDTEKIIERAKGVDVELATRILEDAYMNNFEQCVIFTSDSDYMPVIRAIRRKGKNVIVAGYEDGMGKKSALRYEPDEVWNLTTWMKGMQPTP